MRPESSFKKSCFAVLILSLYALGCVGTTPPVTYYVLNALPSEKNSAGLSAGSNGTIGVGPVDIPEMLNRPHIVTRTGVNRVDMAEFHRWGGSLKKGMTEVVVEDLSVMMGNFRVYAFPKRNYPVPDYQVVMTFHQFDGRLGGSVFLDATWAIVAPSAGQAPLRVKRSTISTPVEKTGYAAFVAAQSRALSDLSREIAETINDVRGE